MTYYLLVRKKGTKKYIGAIPGRKGKTRSDLNRVKQRLKTGYTGIVVNKKQLFTIIKRQTPKSIKR